MITWLYFFWQHSTYLPTSSWFFLFFFFNFSCRSFDLKSVKEILDFLVVVVVWLISSIYFFNFFSSQRFVSNERKKKSKKNFVSTKWWRSKCVGCHIDDFATGLSDCMKYRKTPEIWLNSGIMFVCIIFNILVLSAPNNISFH